MRQVFGKRERAVFIILLMFFLPMQQVVAQRSSEFENLKERTKNIPQDFRDQAEVIGGQLNDRFDSGVPGELGTIGEDIILQVKEYQPKIIRSSLLEDQGVFVYALLSGQPTNPTISIPNIKNVVIRRQKVTTNPVGAPVSIGRVRHIKPSRAELSFDNMGYMVIPIRQIPRENDVPDEVLVDVDARIFFDVSEGLTFGPTKDILVEQNKDQWALTKEDHSFYAGFIRVSEISDIGATVALYDNNVNEVRGSPIELKVGQTSRSLSARSEFGYSRTGKIFDRFNLKLDRITALSDKARLIISRDGKVETRTLSEGEFLYPGSSWFIENIITDVRGEEFTVKLRNRNSFGAFGGSASKKLACTDFCELKAKKLKINASLPPVPAKKPKTAVPQDKSLVAYKNIKEKEYDKVVIDLGKGFKDYSSVVKNLEKLRKATSPLTSLATKNLIDNLLKTIQREYNAKRVERQLAINRDNHSIITKDVEVMYEYMLKLNQKLAGDKTRLPSAQKTDASATGLIAYQQAREEYQKVIDGFTSSKDLEIRKHVAKAHWRIANLPGDIVSKDSRIQHLDVLLNNFEVIEYDGFTKQNLEILLKILKSLQLDYQSVSQELSEPSTGEIFSVLLAGAEKASAKLKSRATLTLDGARTNTYIEGEPLLWPETGSPGSIRWNVKEINTRSVIIARADSGETIRINLNAEVDKVPILPGAGNVRKVKLIDTDVKKEAHVTISPVVESAYSEAIFSLHLPIEKRAFDLPLFSDTVEEEIVKTEDLLEDLNEIVENVREITEYWQKICLVTFGVLWAKNFLAGAFGKGNAADARQKVGSMYKEKYAHCQTLDRSDPESCAGKTYEQFVFSKQAEYETAIEQSSKITEGIQNLESSGYYTKQENFPELGKEYNGAKAELYYYEEMSKLHPNDETTKTKVLTLRSQLKHSDLERQFSDVYFEDGRLKTFDELGSNAKGIVGATINYPGLKPARDELISKLSDAEKVKIAEATKNGIFEQHVWNTHGKKLIPYYKESIVKQQLGTYITTDLKKQYSVEQKHLDNLFEAHRIKNVDSALVGNFKHAPSLSFATKGKGKDNVEFVSIDALHYVQVSYRTGGRVEKYELFRRSSPNSQMGHRSDVYLGVVDEQLLTNYRKSGTDDHKSLSKNLDNVRSCISRINKQNSKTKYSRSDKVQTKPIGCSGLGNYVVKNSVQGSDRSCTDFMSPSDCKLLFNACDPVICPTSRCNLGGDWPVENVAETGIIGSALLCLPNFIGVDKDAGVVMPVCLTGIHAGLQNIRSIIEGYRQCLITAKVSGRSVGICDRIRSFGICEVLWKEGMALVSAKEGILGKLIGALSDDDGSGASGGGEYSAFQDTLDNSAESLKFFTQSYAKNTFARYSGGSLPEIGTEICKAAIFRKAPGVGNFFDEVTRPESPPQFNAFFDEVPYSDIGERSLSQYKIFYHVYAGETSGVSPVTYSVWLQSKDPYTNEFIYPPQFLRDSRGIVRGRRLPSGGFASEAPDMILPTGMQEICVEIVTDTYGRRVECGFGKVSTGFALNYVTDKFTQGELNKKINSASECVSKSSTIADAVSERGLVAGVGVGVVGTVSSGFTSTGIVRKCSKVSPGIGGDEAKWSPVGSCGIDDLDRDMGTCWLYVPTAQNLIKQVSARTQFQNTLNETARRVIAEAEKAGSPIPGFEVLEKKEIQTLFDLAKTAREDAIKTNDVAKFVPARKNYNKIRSAYAVDEKFGANAQFFLAETYWEEARILIATNSLVNAAAATIKSMRGVRRITLPHPPVPMAKNSMVEIEIFGTVHKFEVKSMSGGKITLEVRSTPQEFLLKQKDKAIEVDVNGDRKPDITIQYVKDKALNAPGLGEVVAGMVWFKEIKASTPAPKVPKVPKDPKDPKDPTPSTSGKKCTSNGFWADSAGKRLPTKSGSSPEVATGTPVAIVVNAINCNGKTLKVGIEENDDYFDESVSGFPKEIKIDADGTVTKLVPWTTEYLDDGWFGGNPEFIFRIFYGEEELFKLLDRYELVVTKNKYTGPLAPSIKPVIKSITPSILLDGEPAVVEIVGENFDKNVQVFYPTVSKPDLMHLRKDREVIWVSDKLLKVDLTKSLPLPGWHFSLLVRNPDKQVSNLEPVTVLPKGILFVVMKEDASTPSGFEADIRVVNPDTGRNYRIQTAKSSSWVNWVDDLVEHNGRIYGAMRPNVIPGTVSEIFDMFSDDRAARRDSSTFALVSHDGELYDAGLYGFKETFGSGSISGMEVYDMVSNDGKFYAATTTGIFAKSGVPTSGNLKYLYYMVSGEVHTLTAHKDKIYYSEGFDIFVDDEPIPLKSRADELIALVSYNGKLYDVSDKIRNTETDQVVFDPVGKEISAALSLEKLSKVVAPLPSPTPPTPAPITPSPSATKEHAWAWYYNAKKYEVKVDIPAALTERYYKLKPHPTGEIGGDYTPYVLDSDDDVVIRGIARQILEIANAENMDDWQKFFLVSSFVKGNFAYQLDAVSAMCSEYPRYPLEMILSARDNKLGIGDCEDAAILTAALLKELGYDISMVVLGPVKPGDGAHASLAVKCDAPFPPAHFKVPPLAWDFAGKKYCYYEAVVYSNTCLTEYKSRFPSLTDLGAYAAPCQLKIGEIFADFARELDLTNPELARLVSPKAYLKSISANLKSDGTFELTIKNTGSVIAKNVWINKIFGVDATGTPTTTPRNSAKVDIPAGEERKLVIGFSSAEIDVLKAATKTRVFIDADNAKMFLAGFNFT